MLVRVKQTNGITYACNSLTEALEELKEVYGADIVTEGDIRKGAVLVWADAESAENDDGARAVAKITKISKILENL
jgi:hypothetical protein